MQHQEVTPADLSLLEKSILFELRMMKWGDPTFPVSKAELARRLHWERGEILTALFHLYEDLRLIGPVVLDLENIELTELGEDLAKRLNGCAVA